MICYMKIPKNDVIFLAKNHQLPKRRISTDGVAQGREEACCISIRYY